jgi:hypothetical protein
VGCLGASDSLTYVWGMSRPHSLTQIVRPLAAVVVIGVGGIATIGIGASLLIVGHVCGESGAGCTAASNGDVFAAIVLCTATYIGCTALAARIMLGRGAFHAAGPARAAALLITLIPLFPMALLITLWVNEHHHGHAIAVTTFLCAAVPPLLLWAVLARRLAAPSATAGP